jgi:hypothetical protein
MRVCGTVSQVFNLHRDRIYLHGLASLFGHQNEILRYSRTGVLRYAFTLSDL